MPSRNGFGYAPSELVWKTWTNSIGYSSNGFVFCAGMLNGAYAVGTPDCVTHLAEEIPQPSKNLPKAIGIQMLAGFVTAVGFLLALFYSVNDFDKLLHSESLFPLGEIFAQAFQTRAGTLGLSLVVLIPTFFTNIGTYITCGRMMWTLARDRATPFSNHMGQLQIRWDNPFNATLGCGVVSTVMGFIYLGSSTAFNAFVGSFVVLTTLSYLGAILPYLLTNRKHVVLGWFKMPRLVFIPLATIACLYMVAFDIIFCFPYYLPTTADSMNYTSVIVVGLTVLISGYWVWKGRRDYIGPDLAFLRSIQGQEVAVEAPEGDNMPRRPSHLKG
jgi:amino acid transporter